MAQIIEIQEGKAVSPRGSEDRRGLELCPTGRVSPLPCSLVVWFLLIGQRFVLTGEAPANANVLTPNPAQTCAQRSAFSVNRPCPSSDAIVGGATENTQAQGPARPFPLSLPLQGGG